LARISIPVLPRQIVSPWHTYRAIEGQTRNTILTGKLVESEHVNSGAELEVHIENDIEAGCFVIVDDQATAQAYVSVMYGPGNPKSFEFPLWSQFNPFDYPVYAKLVHEKMAPRQTMFTLGLS
jgi:hypothetical protein